MARRTINGGTIVSIKLGQEIEAYFITSRDIQTQTGNKSVHDFIAYKDFTAVTKKDKQDVNVDILKGQQFSMWGTTVLNKDIKMLAPGQFCAIKFAKETPTTKGNAAKIFEIQVDDDIPNLDESDVVAVKASSEPDAKPETAAEAAVNSAGTIDDDLPF